MKRRIELLIEAASLLASPAHAQLDHLKSLGLDGHIDELALEYDDAATAAEDMLQCGELCQKQHDVVKKLKQLLSRMSGKANSRLWTVAAVTSSSEWDEVRKAARDCMQALNGQ